MFHNAKATAIILTPQTLGASKSTGTITRLKHKSRGYVTFEANGKPGRVWGRIGNDDELSHRVLTKAQVEKLPSPLPAGVCLQDKQCGAVTRKMIVGDPNETQSL